MVDIKKGDYVRYIGKAIPAWGLESGTQGRALTGSRDGRVTVSFGRGFGCCYMSANEFEVIERPPEPVVIGSPERDRLIVCREENNLLREALRDAIELADEGWGYAGEYFRNKWNYNAQIAKLKAVLNDAVERERLETGHG